MNENMNEKDLALAEDMAEQEMDVPEAELIEENLKISPKKVKLGALIDDENDLIEIEMPDFRQRRDIRRMNNDIRAGRICYGRVFGMEENSEKNEIRILLKRDSIKIIIPADDFFALSDLNEDIHTASKAERFIRYRRRISHMMNSIVSFIPLAMGENESGVPFAVASRKKAMEKLQERHFFSDNADVEVGSLAKASILSVGPRYIFVECLGVESTLGTGALSAFNYIEDANDFFNVGDGLVVAVEHLNVDKENKKVNISFSRSLVERNMVKIERVGENMINGRYDAKIINITRNHYIAMLTGPKIKGLIPLNKYRGIDRLLPNDDIVMLVTGVDEEKNQVIGSCIKKK